jgi:hypothetical protein
MVRGKRGGNTLLYFRAACLILAVVAFTVIMRYAVAASNNTLLEKNFRARDIGLLITTLYASPSGVNYTYLLKEDFSLEVGGGEIIVSDKNDDDAQYWYTRPADGTDIVGTDGSTPVIIEGKKNNILQFQRGRGYLILGVAE